MNRIFKIGRRAAAVLALAALGVAALSSCEPTEEILPSLDAPQPRLVSSTVSSLTFAWDKVANTTQYTYELLSADGTSVDGGVTPGLKAEFTGLKDNTTYTFRLMAHPEVLSESYGSSQEAIIAAQTEAIIPLEAPSLIVDLESGVTVSWFAVDNAAYYIYTCKSDNGTDISGTTTDTSVTLSGLKTGDYMVSVTAYSENEAYSTSETAYSSFSYVETKDEIWRVNGSVDDGAGKTWIATLVAWSNGSYTIKNWYGTEGYDLEFYVNSDATITVTNKTTSEGYDYVAANADEWICIDTNYYEGYGAYSSFSGTKLTGEIWFWSYETNGYYDFVWNSGSGSSLTIDDVVGTYTQKSTGEQIFDGYNWTGFTSTNDVTIEKVDDTTVTVTGIMYAGYSLTAKFDAAAATLTFEPQTWLDWYVFCAYDAPTTSVIANISDGVITLSGWTAYYTDYSYSYVWSAETVLTKK
jgi:hypothetical protein